MTQAQYAGALLITPENQVALQQRDDKPGIMNPGLITTFGGLVEPGENPNQTIVHEMAEELSLDIDTPTLYKIFQKTMAEHGEDRQMYIYLIDNIDPQELRIHEGQGYVLVSKLTDLNTLKLTPICRQIIQDYFSDHLT